MPTGTTSSERLAGIADLFLTHDRPIEVRCDDSVTRVWRGIELPLRRSRGYAPVPIALPIECLRPILAVGGQLKATFALSRGRQAFLSHHMGDLDHYDAYRAFEQDVQLYQQLFAIQPECLVRDLHPDYLTTRYADERGAREGIPVLTIQHHHAHMASCMAEHGLIQPAIGVAFDGTGYGTDGAVWGGEFLVGDYKSFRRGAPAVRRYAGWRPSDPRAMAHGPGPSHGRRGRRRTICGTIFASRSRGSEEDDCQTVGHTANVERGRLFDAVASLAGVRDRVSYEGQAAVELEWLASEALPEGVYPFALSPPRDEEPQQTPLVVDTRPLIRAVAEDVAGGALATSIARRFHSTIVTSSPPCAAGSA